MAAGLGFGVAGLLVALVLRLEVSFRFDNTEGHVTWFTLFIGLFGTGCLFWWLLISRPQRGSARRGAVTGALVALFSYPVVLLLAEFVQRDWHGGLADGSVSERIRYVLLLSGLSLATTGSAAMLSLAAVGALMAWLFVRLNPELQGERSPGVSHRLRWARLALTMLAGLLAAIVVLLGAAFLWLTLLPIDDRGLSPEKPPVSTYEQAMAAFQQVEAKESTMALNPVCASRLLTHGKKVSRVVVFFHGLTNCPNQADVLAQQLFERGYDVYVPRLPKHGEADRLTLALSQLTAEELAASAADAASLAGGLGDDVVVAGLSAGGTMSAWLAQNSSDTDRAILVSPFLGPHVVPPWALPAATNLLLLVPNMMVWWDASNPEGDPAMDYAYPRFATRALGEIMRLGLFVAAQARIADPKAGAIGVLLNGADEAVNNRVTEDLIAAWRANGREVELQVLDPSRHLPHDIIDPRQEAADIGYVYPRLIDMLAQGAAN